MTALALRDDQNQWEPSQLAALRQTGIDEDISEAELQVFLHECQRRKLDPFSRQIYLIGRWNKARKRKEYRSQTGIDGFRVIARRAADKTGIEYSYEDTLWFDGNGRAYQAWVTPQAPAAAKVVIVRNGQRFDAVARFGAYVQTDRDGNPSGQWREMPDVMVAKCAEALALRKAFPEDLGGIYTEEEMAQADNPQRVTATAEVVRDEPAPGNGRQRAAERSGGTPQEDPWYVRDAPQDDQPDPPAGGARPWAEDALKQARARKFKSEPEAWALWREAAVPGRCTPEQKDEIQNRTAAWIKANRRKASDTVLRQLPEAAADWKAAVEGLNGDDIEACRETLEEVGRLKAAGTMNETLAGRVAGAIIALCPKAAMRAGDEGA